MEDRTEAISVSEVKWSLHAAEYESLARVWRRKMRHTEEQKQLQKALLETTQSGSRPPLRAPAVWLEFESITCFKWKAGGIRRGEACCVRIRSLSAKVLCSILYCAMSVIPQLGVSEVLTEPKPKPVFGGCGF